MNKENLINYCRDNNIKTIIFNNQNNKNTESNTTNITIYFDSITFIKYPFSIVLRNSKSIKTKMSIAYIQNIKMKTDNPLGCIVELTTQDNNITLILR